MLTRIDKALVAGAGAAGSVLTAALTRGNGIGLADAELAIGAFIVVGFLAWLVPNKAAA